jgi:hypothetical protein
MLSESILIKLTASVMQHVTVLNTTDSSSVLKINQYRTGGISENNIIFPAEGCDFNFLATVCFQFIVSYSLAHSGRPRSHLGSICNSEKHYLNHGTTANGFY